MNSKLQHAWHSPGVAVTQLLLTICEQLYIIVWTVELTVKWLALVNLAATLLVYLTMF